LCMHLTSGRLLKYAVPYLHRGMTWLAR